MVAAAHWSGYADASATTLSEWFQRPQVALRLQSWLGFESVLMNV
jgi:hypothetical protein